MVGVKRAGDNGGSIGESILLEMRGWMKEGGGHGGGGREGLVGGGGREGGERSKRRGRAG